MVNRAIDDNQIPMFSGVQVISRQHRPSTERTASACRFGVDSVEEIPVVVYVDKPFPIGAYAVLTYWDSVLGQCE